MRLGWCEGKRDWGSTISQPSWNSWPLPKSLNCVARMALMFSGSIVMIGVTPGARNCRYLQSSNRAVYLKCIAFNLFSILPHQIEIGIVSIILWSEGLSNIIPRIEDCEELSGNKRGGGLHRDGMYLNTFDESINAEGKIKRNSPRFRSQLRQLGHIRKRRSNIPSNKKDSNERQRRNRVHLLKNHPVGSIRYCP